jgi:hypothetical protein
MPDPPNFKRLPGHVVAPLLRALMSIRRTPERSLYLRRVTERRMLTASAEDYRVYRRIMIGALPSDEPIGNIWLDDRAESTEEKIAPWRWSIDTTRSGTNADGWWAKGRARTREEAMDAFRNAWDSYQPKKGAG